MTEDAQMRIDCDSAVFRRNNIGFEQTFFPERCISTGQTVSCESKIPDPLPTDLDVYSV